MKIGLTGGIACGKSTVASMLVSRGANLVDADQIAREVVMPGQPALRQIASRFGEALIREDGSLDRKALGAIVFGDEKARKELESILHPLIRSLMKERINAYESSEPDKPVIADIPLLYESGLQAMFDEVMLVYIPRELQLKRLTARDGLTEEEANRRIAAQMPIEEKRKLADIVIDNSGTLQETERQIDRFWNRKGWQ